MRFLLDTNIAISAEPTNSGDVEMGAPIVAELIRLLSRGGHPYHIHPATLREIAGDKNEERRNLRELLLQKYSLLEFPPPLDPDIITQLGDFDPRSHDKIDLEILTAVKAQSVDYLVTNDGRLQKRARRLSLGEQVLSAAEAVNVLRNLYPTVPIPPRHVEPRLAHELNPSDAIFASLEQDYSEFRSWFSKVRREHRQTWVIRQKGIYAGICIVNQEDRPTYGLEGKTLKLCTFKISPDSRGYRYGELLLKTLFEYLLTNSYDNVFVEVFEKHTELIDLFEDFGFEQVGSNTRGELALSKIMSPRRNDLNSFAFHTRYGPHHVKVDEAGIFVVPIRPQYHRLLFPEADKQLHLLADSHPFSNSIRKAYLCHSRIKTVVPGSVLLFYRSEDERAITAIGVAESTLTSANPDELARFVARRTVYSYEDIKSLAQTGSVLATQFRLARVLETPLPLSLIKSSGILGGVPQSFASVRKESIPWIVNQLALWH